MHMATKNAMEYTLINQYGSWSVVSNAWDSLQSMLRCCAVDDAGWNIYRRSYWIRANNHYPNISGDVVISEIDPSYVYVPIACCVHYNDPDWFYVCLVLSL